MALDPKIASIRAAGTYRYEFNKSQVVSIPANQLRLIVGFSKKGPFNTPVFVPDSGFFKQIFGDIDRNLERKYSYFHRSCLTALERGPILALNLLNLDSDDDVNYIKMGTSATPNVQDNEGASAEYRGFYNNDKFYYPDSDSFLNNVGAVRTTLSSLTTNDLLDFVNLGQKPISIIVKKSDSRNVTSFNITVEEWYGVANVPEYLDKDSLISDFMIDVYVIEGNFGGDFSSATPYERFEADPTFQDYFDTTLGLQRKINSTDLTDTMMAQFFNETEVNVIASYTGSLIPDFIDLVGNNLFIETLVNAETATTGLFCAVNSDLFSGDFLIDGVPGGIDLIGHTIEYAQTSGIQTNVNFLSYGGPIVSDLSYPRTFVTPNTVDVSTGDVITVTNTSSGDTEIVVTGSAGDTLYDAFATMEANSSSAVGTFMLGAVTGEYIPVISVTITASTVTVILSGYNAGDFPTTIGTTYTYINEEDFGFMASEFAVGTDNSIIGSYGSTLYTAYSNGTVTDGDEAVYQVGGLDYTSYLVFNSIAAGYGFIHVGATAPDIIAISDSDYFIPAVRLVPYEEDTFQTQTPIAEFNINGAGYFLESDGTPYAATTTLGVQTLKGANNLTIDILADHTDETALKPNQVLIDAGVVEAGDVVVGNYLVHFEGSVTIPYSRLTRINEVVGGLTNSDYASIPAGNTGLLVTCQSEIDITTSGYIKKVELYYPIDKWIDYLNIFTLDGFTLDPTKHVPDGTNDRQNEILTGTLSGTPLFYALTDRETINFRYVVDTFGNGIESGSKSILTYLCQSRKNSFAILNAPSAKNFKMSTDPSFLDSTGALSSKYISDGGNLSLNPSVRYSLPADTQGASWGAFYYPNITVRDLGKNINVPPAAYVSNNYVAKYENALPWSIIAGVRRGVVGGTGVVGLEVNLDRDDREYLEPFGLNPIVFQSGTGPTIFANKTALQTPKSALSSINVREVVIYIQDGIEAILRNYMFEANTAQTRLEIKTLADNFLTTVQNDDGVYDFRNIMDESNNTPEIIDQNIGILDTYIEPVRGLEILVQRITILKTGAISTGNFQ